MEVDLEFLRNGGFEKVRAWLLDLNGIGPLSASFITIRGLGRMKELPTDDKALLISAL